MKHNRRFLRLVGAFVTAVLPLAASQAAATAQPDEAPLRKVVEQFTDSWNRGDAGAAAATFTADGVLIAGDGTQTSGRSQIEQYLIRATPKGAQFTQTITSVQFLDANVAVLRTEGGFLSPGETAVAPERRGVQSIIMVRDGTTWRIALAQRTRTLAYGKPSGQ